MEISRGRFPRRPERRGRFPCRPERRGRFPCRPERRPVSVPIPIVNRKRNTVLTKFLKILHGCVLTGIWRCGKIKTVKSLSAVQRCRQDVILPTPACNLRAVSLHRILSARARFFHVKINGGAKWTLSSPAVACL